LGDQNNCHGTITITRLTLTIPAFKEIKIKHKMNEDDENSSDAESEEDNAEDDILALTPVRARLRTAAVRNAKRRGGGEDKTYRQVWTSFRKWVDSQNLSKQPHYLSRDNIDLYFATEIANKLFTPANARRYVSGLQFYADTLEHAGSNPRFEVESSDVKQALLSQKTNYTATVVKSFIDMHDDLPTNVMSVEDALRCIKYSIPRPNWASICICITGGFQIFLRGKSVRNATIPTLRLDENHGPRRPNSTSEQRIPILSQVLPRGTQKKKNERTRVAGAYRHKNVYLCWTSMTAMRLFIYLNEILQDQIHFYGGTNGNPPKWYSHFLVDFRVYNTHRDAFARMYKNLGITWNKCTHLRKVGIDYAAFNGCDKEKISQMSKHGKDRIDLSYLPEMPPDVMQVLAGYSLARGNPQVYHNERIYYDVNHWGDAYARAQLLWPQINRWRQQCASPQGDKGEAARNFLWKVLPYLSEVILQDGIYWIQDFPTHEVSIRLKSIQGYEQWANEARIEIANRAESQSNAAIAQLSVSCQTAFNHLQNAQNEKFAELKNLILGVNQQVQVIERNQTAHVYPMFRPMLRNFFAPTPFFAPGNQAVIRSTTANAAMTNTNAATAPNAVITTFNGTAAAGQTAIPIFPRTLPNTMKELVEQHLRCSLESYYTATKTQWPQATQMMFSKR